MTTKEDPPKIEFPCEDYVIKIMGTHSDDYQERMLEIVERHAPGFDRSKVSYKVSGKGTFRSINLFITATGPEQLHALHMDLRSTPETKMVL